MPSSFSTARNGLSPLLAELRGKNPVAHKKPECRHVDSPLAQPVRLLLSNRSGTYLGSAGATIGPAGKSQDLRSSRALDSRPRSSHRRCYIAYTPTVSFTKHFRGAPVSFLPSLLHQRYTFARCWPHGGALIFFQGLISFPDRNYMNGFHRASWLDSCKDFLHQEASVMKRFLIVLASLVALLLPTMAFAGGSQEGKGSKLQVGVVLPTKDEERWTQDQTRFQDAFAKAGYNVQILFSEKDSAKEKGERRSPSSRMASRPSSSAPSDGSAAAAAADEAHKQGSRSSPMTA